MKGLCGISFGLFLFISTPSSAQKKSPLPDVSKTIKGNLFLPAPIGNPLFNSSTETIGQVDGVFQFPVLRGLGLGIGGKMTWYAVNERALAPEVTTGDIRRRTFYGKVQFEEYTGPKTFYELHARFGVSRYRFDCPTCGDSQSSGFHWGLGAAYYIHASDNLAFGLTLGYEMDAARFSAGDLGLESFPGKVQKEEQRNYQNFLVGIGFSTRLRKAPDNGRGW